MVASIFCHMPKRIVTALPTSNLEGCMELRISDAPWHSKADTDVTEGEAECAPGIHAKHQVELGAEKESYSN